MKKLLTLLLAFLSFSIAQGANMLTSAEVNVTRLSTTRPVTISLSTAVRKSLSALSNSGATVKMQWYSQNGESGTPTAMTGQTSYQLSVTPSNSAVFSKRFFVRVSITSGGTTKSENSELARLVSNTSITQQPTDQEYINGTNKPVVFTASASTCVDRTRRWYKNGVEIADGAAGFSGQSTDSLVIDVVASGVKDGDKFSMRANSPYGKTAYAESNKAYLSIRNDYSLDFSVCGTDVMASMADDIRPKDNSLKSGKIYFANNTLYLDNIFVDTSEDFLFLEEGNNIGDIKILGTDSIRCEKLIVYDHDMVGASTLGGPGKLSVVAYDYLIDGRSGATHVFEDANLSISCYSFVNRCNLIINHSNISAHSAYFAQDSKEDTSLRLQKCAITTPGVTFNSSTLAFMNGSEETGDFEIEAHYGVMVEGKWVTDKNKDDVLGDGKVKFDVTTNTLVLTNATITSNDFYGIKIEEDNITIQLNGNNEITCKSNYGIGFVNCVGGKIVGPGSATIVGKLIGLFADHSDITIKECVLYIVGNNYGLCGYEHLPSENVTIDNAYVSMVGKTIVSCGDLNSLTLTNAQFSPSSVAFYPSLHGVSTDGGNTLTNSGVRVVPSTGGYPIDVMGVTLYSFNAADPLGDGTVSYDAANKTLTLNKANLSHSGCDVIAVWDDINIQLKDSNTIICSEGYNQAIYVDDAYITHITGKAGASLHMISNNDAAFCGGELHISGGCMVSATGMDYGINCQGNDMYIDGSTVIATATGTTAGNFALSGLKSIHMAQAQLATTGVSFNSTKGTYVDGDGNGAKQVVIEPVYGISVQGISVTNENKNDVLGDGTVKYDVVTKTLILTNATISLGVGNAINITEDNVTIQLNGINKISSGTSSAIYFGYCTGIKIVGPGSATLTGSTIGIYASYSDITIKECVLYIKGNNYGLCGYGHYPEENVTIDNAYVSITGTGYYSCGDLNSLTLKNAKFASSGIAFYPSLYGVSTDGGNTLTKNTFIIAPSTGGYPIDVMGVTLYSFNAADPMGDGTVSYDAASKTLTLDNAKLTYNDYDVIAVWEDININLIGTNNVVCDGNYNALNVDDSYTTYISGDDQSVLNLTSKVDGFYGGELHISGGCTVNAAGESFGLALTGEDLYVDGSNLIATNTSSDAVAYAISGLKNAPSLTNAYVATEGISYDATKQTYVDGDGNIAKTITIKAIENYGIEVGGIQVTSQNANNIPVSEGTATYDPTTKVLTLNNVKTESTSLCGINIQTDNVTIKLIGDNTIGAKDLSDGLYILRHTGTQITGPGKATFIGGLGIYIQESDLTISDCEVIAKGNGWGIAGDYKDGEILTIRNAKVTAELVGDEDEMSGTIMDLKDLILDGVSILSPTGATYNATTGDIEVEGAVTKETVVIGKETPVYTLTISAGENGSVNTAVNGTYEEGTSVELIATANSGYKFEKWSDGNAENPRTLVMDKDYTLTASFIKESVIIVKYTIQADANDAAMGSVSGAGEYVENSDVTLVATANTGYEFVNWTKGGTEVSTSATYTFKATENVTLVANFKAEVYYTIAASTNNATMGSVSGAGNYKENSDVTLTATANTGYVFVNWTKGGAEVSTSSTYTFKATENVTLVANFKAADPNKYTVVLTINNPIMGTATGAGEYDKNASVTLKAIANTGYEFVNWTKDGSEVSTDTEYTFTITENVALQANFKALANPVTLTVYSIGEGTVNGKAIFTKTVEKGTTITLTATPNTGSELLHWNTKDYGDTETTIDVDMDGDITIAAIFGSDADSYKLTARADDDEEEYGKVSIQLCVDEMNDTYIKAISGIYPKDTRFKIQAIAADGYEFVCWNKDDEEPNTNAIRNIVLSKKTSLYAHFKKATGLDEVMNAGGDNTMYDILGRRVDANYRGIVIINGKKTLMR